MVTKEPDLVVSCYAPAHAGYAAQQTARLSRVLSFLEGAPMSRILSRFLSLVHRNSAVHLLVATAFASLALLAAVAPAGAQSSAPLDKHARKIEKRLAKFRQGTFLDFEFRDSSKTFGALGPLSSASFQFTDSDSNKTQTHLYSDLVQVKQAREYIGEGTEPRHHVRLLVPVIIGAAVAAGGIAAYEVLH